MRREGGRKEGGAGGREHEVAFASSTASRISQQAKICVKVFSEGGRRCLLGLAAKCAQSFRFMGMGSCRGSGWLSMFSVSQNNILCIPQGRKLPVTEFCPPISCSNTNASHKSSTALPRHSSLIPAFRSPSADGLAASLMLTPTMTFSLLSAC